MQIKKIAQSCQSGNKAKMTLITLRNNNMEKNFIVPDISRSSIWSIGPSAGLRQRIVFLQTPAGVLMYDALTE
jgi:hypothetical protein